MIVRRLSLAVLASLCALGCGFVFASAPALARRGHAFEKAFGGQGSGPGQLVEPDGVAVNEATGQVYVVDKGNNRVEWFSAEGAYEGEFNGSGLLLNEGKAAGSGGQPEEIESGQFSEPAGIAVDNSGSSEDPSAGDVYVVDRKHDVIDKFGPTGEYLGQVIVPRISGASVFLFGVTVDSHGEVWVSEFQNIAHVGVDHFGNGTGNEFHEFFSGEVSFSSDFGLENGLVTDSKDNIYINGETRSSKGVFEYDSAGKFLREVVNSTPTSAVAIEPSSGDLYLDNVESVGRFGPDGGLIERFGSGHLTAGSGVAVNSSSGTVYVADSTVGVVDVFPLQPPSPPTVESVSVSDVTSESATLDTEVNPRGVPTEYRFEYGPCASPGTCATSAYEGKAPVPDAFVGADFEVRAFSIHLQDLSPHTVYHLRVVAHNELGVADGEELTFTTQTSGGASELPDGRSWEMVTPAQKMGALFDFIGHGPIKASSDGHAFEDLASQPTEAEPLGNPPPEVSVLSTRGSAGWSSQDISPPTDRGVGTPTGAGVEYKFFSEDLSQGVVQPFGQFTPLSPEASEPTAYLRTDYSNGDVSAHCQSSCFRPLVTAGNTPPGTVFGEEPKGHCEVVFCGATFIDATPDLSHIVLEVQGLGNVQGLSIVEWADGKLTPTGDIAPPPSVSRHVSIRHGISNDGSRIVNGLLLHDMVTGETVQLDLGMGAGTYMDASSDDSRIFFLDGGDLFEYDLNAPLGSRVTDLTVDEHANEVAEVAQVVGASEDGSYVYFDAAGALAPGAEHGKCGYHEIGSAVCNLYVRHAGVTRLVAALSAEDSPDWESNFFALPVRVSPNGRWLAFMSNRNLTGYDTHDALSGRSDEEVYLYDAVSGKLVCASCNPNGSRPVGVDRESVGERQRLVGGPTSAFAANVPLWTTSTLVTSFYQSRYLSDSGRLFFNSNDALVPQDVNGTEDVYEYEPVGVPSQSPYECTAGSGTFSVLSGGCVGLVSSGASAEESAFLDASTTGGHVFFLTQSKLVSEDFDTALDVYDAHECSAQEPCFARAPVPPPVCSTGDSCKAAPSPQPALFGSPSSATFSGAGNVTPAGVARMVRSRSATRARKLARALRACQKRKSRAQHAACVRNARKRYGSGRASGKANSMKKGGR
jgi:hypothetical protein